MFDKIAFSLASPTTRCLGVRRYLGQVRDDHADEDKEREGEFKVAVVRETFARLRSRLVGAKGPWFENGHDL